MSEPRARTIRPPRWHELVTDGTKPAGINVTGLDFDKIARRSTAGMPPPCVYLGDWIREETGVMKTQDCAGCTKTVRLKVYACSHLSHNGETTLAGCKGCPDYEPALSAL